MVQCILHYMIECSIYYNISCYVILYYIISSYHNIIYYSGTYSSVVRVSASGGEGPGFNPHHIKLSGLEVRPLKVSGGSPVHLRSKNTKTCRKDPLCQKRTNHIIIYYSVAGGRPEPAPRSPGQSPKPGGRPLLIII